MKLTFKMNVNGVEKQMDAVVENLSDLTPPLKRLGKWLRFKAKKKFDQEGPGWPALSAETLSRRRKKGREQVGKKLETSVTKARAKTDGDAIKNANSLARKDAALKEFKRLEAGGKIDSVLVSEKKSSAIKSRISKAEDKASKKILGKLSSSLAAEIKHASLRVYSKANEIALVHNEGGTAGHGAHEPQREFLVLDEEDLEIFEGFLLDAMEEHLG